jgi:hypothetical protein
VLVIAGGASAGSRSIPVTLSIPSSGHPEPGQAVALKAKAGKLPKGDDLLVQGRRSTTAKPFKVRECGTATCYASWKRGTPGRVYFQALVVRRGHVSTVLGRSKLVPIVWKAASSPPPGPPAPPPPPTPSGPPQAGHYAGTTVAFDVDAGGTSLSNVQIAQVSATCEPPARALAGPWTIAGPIPIQSNRTFSFDGSTPEGGAGSVSGSFGAAGSVTGSFKIDRTPINAFGQAFICTSGAVTWSATKSG